ncbi:hypothetical protein JCM11251_005658 [Rhodosporidiobolus azoricus]
MGLLPLSNHLALIKDCYPPSKDLSATTHDGTLPSPLSNPLGKLTFYAVHRPQKTPKVLSALHSAALTFSRSAASSARARAELGVTVEVVRSLVVEWGESGREEAAGVVKSAVAEEALGVAELALRGGAEGRAGRASGGKRDVEMEARGASLFAAVATYLSPPFFPTSTEESRSTSSTTISSSGGADGTSSGGGGMGKAYLRCLALVGALAQVEGGEDAFRSRQVALQALLCASRSEFLISPASARDYDKQVEEIVPALVANLGDGRDVEGLREQLSDVVSSSSALDPLSPSLSSRKAPSIPPPAKASSPSDSSLSRTALTALSLLTRLAPSPLSLSSLLHALSSYLDRHSSGSFWKAPSQPFVLFLAQDLFAGKGAARDDGMRAAAAMWWIDRLADVYESGAEHKSVTILFVVRHLLLDEHTAGVVSRPAALLAVTDLLVRRARFRPRGVHSPMGSPNDSMGDLLAVATEAGAGGNGAPTVTMDAQDEEPDLDPLLAPLLSTIGAVAQSASSSSLSSGNSYKGEMDDLASSLLQTVLSVTSGEARVVSGMSVEEKRRAGRRAVRAWRRLVVGVEGLEPAPATVEEGGANGHFLHPEQPHPEPRRGASETTVLPSTYHTPYSSTPLATPTGTDGTVSVPGLHLGTPIAVNGSPSIPTQLVTPASPTNSASASPYPPSSPPLTPTSASPASASTSSTRDSISPSTFAPSLPLLLRPDPPLRADYALALRSYIKREKPQGERWWRLVNSAVYALASGEIRASPPPDHAADSGSNEESPLTDSPSSRDFATLPTEALPSARDYSLLLSLLLSSINSAPSASCLVEGFPALLALSSQAATNWEVGLAGSELGAAAGGKSGGEVRAKTCREIAAWAVQVAGRRWGVREVEEHAGEVLAALQPHVLPSPSSLSSSALPPSAFLASSPPHSASLASASRSTTLDGPHLIDLFASSDKLQQASGLRQAELAARLGRTWEAVKVEDASSSRSPYLSSGGGANTLPSRSFVNLSLGGPSPSSALNSPSILHLGLNGSGGSTAASRAGSRAGSTLRLHSSSVSHSVHSSRHASLAVSATGTTWTGASRLYNTPSLADLQSSLGGGGARSARTSAAPSVVSSVGGGSAEFGGGVGGSGSGGGSRRRRTPRGLGGADGVLERIGQGKGRNGSRTVGGAVSGDQ